MDNHSGHWFHQQHPNLNLSGFQIDVARANTELIHGNSNLVNDSTLRNVPLFPTGQTVETSPAQKRFLVFHQSGERITYTSIVNTTVLSEKNSMQKPLTTCNSVYSLRPIPNIENIEDVNSKDFVENEMHEDTEELNALLYSDTGSYFSEDDDEKSTGHSPSTVTENRTQDSVEEIGEEVDSFSGPTKRQKLLHGGYANNNTCSALEDDVRSRKERICETVSILKNIIPNTNGKNAIAVIDEAIHFLRSLKVKAKALGLDAL